jgi:hypothetical protein
VKRRPLYFYPFFIAGGYTALLVSVASLSIHPYIAQLHPHSPRYAFGALMDRAYPFVTIPMMPLSALLNWLDIGAGWFFSLPLIFIYIFLISCFVTVLLRRAFRSPTNVA